MKFAFVLFEATLIVGLLYVIISQILLPGLRGTRLWPAFRREHRLKEQVIDLNQQRQEDEIADELEARRREWYGTTTQAETDAAQAADQAAKAAKDNK